MTSGSARGTYGWFHCGGPILEAVKHPWFVRLADRLARRLQRAGWRGVPFHPAGTIDAARRSAGLSDLGDPAFEEGLTVLCASAEEADLSLFGRLLLHKVMQQALVHRLRRVELQRTHPEVFDTPLNAPVIVVGLPRSGTTHLHRLLASATDARALATWEVRGPLPGAGIDLRRLQTQLLVRYFRHAAPALDSKHHLDVDAPEECVFLLEDSMESLGFWMLFPVHRYLSWLQSQDGSHPYAAYRQYLQVFQAQTPHKRLVLKAPAHTLHLRALLQAVPEARLVQTHRDPVPVVGSVNSLFHTFHSLTSNQVDHRLLGRTNLDLLGVFADRCLAARESIGVPVLDVSYEELCENAAKVVRGLGVDVGLSFDDALDERLRIRPQGAQGVHRYQIEEAGLEEQAVRRRFASYRLHFGV